VPLSRLHARGGVDAVGERAGGRREAGGRTKEPSGRPTMKVKAKGLRALTETASEQRASERTLLQCCCWR